MIYDLFIRPKKQIAVLIDPDKHTQQSLQTMAALAQEHNADYIFVGGSLLQTDISNCIDAIKEIFTNPIILFPGHATQVYKEADAILFLSLISGRNPEFLIGNHVIAAPIIKQSNLEVIPTGYMLIETGKTTSVEYMSNTKPIPQNKPDIAVATALAGEMLGLKAIYIEGGSGAETLVHSTIIKQVSAACNIPILVGGGITNEQSLIEVFKAGAQIAVVGTVLETYPEQLATFCQVVKDFNC